MPLYTSILSPADYGVLNIVNTTIMLLTLFSVLGLDSAAHIFFWEVGEDKERRKVFSGWFWVQFFFSFILSAFLFFFSGILSKILFGVPDYAVYFELSCIVLLSGILPSLAINWFRIKRQPWTTTWFSLALGLLTILLNVLFIAYFKWGVKGFLLAQIISGAVMSIASLFFMKGWLSPGIYSGSLVKRMLKYSLPLIPAALAYWCLNFAGTYFLQLQKGEGEVGLYQTGSTIASIMMVLISAFTQAWGPFAMSIREQPDADTFYAKVLIVYISVVGLFAAGLGIFSNEFLYFFTNPAYWDAHLVTAILAFNSMVSGVNFIAALGMNFSKNMKPFSLAVICGALFNLAIFYFAIDWFSKEGCAMAILLSNMGVTYFIFRSSQRMYYIPYNFVRTIMILFICVIAVLFSKFFVVHDLWLAIGLKTLLVITLAAVIIYMNRNILLGVFQRIVGKFQFK